MHRWIDRLCIWERRVGDRDRFIYRLYVHREGGDRWIERQIDRKDWSYRKRKMKFRATRFSGGLLPSLLSTPYSLLKIP